MTTKKWMIAIAMLIITANSNVYAQVESVKQENVTVKGADPLKGLRKASLEDSGLELDTIKAIDATIETLTK